MIVTKIFDSFNRKTNNMEIHKFNRIYSWTKLTIFLCSEKMNKLNGLNKITYGKEVNDGG